MFTIEWKEGALKQLEKLPSNIYLRVIKKVNELMENPFSKGIKRLKGTDGFRLRVGDYRVIFDMDLKVRIIYILRIGHRKNIYDNK